jgi:hypothetical protein
MRSNERASEGYERTVTHNQRTSWLVDLRPVQNRQAPIKERTTEGSEAK